MVAAELFSGTPACFGRSEMFSLAASSDVELSSIGRTGLFLHV